MEAEERKARSWQLLHRLFTEADGGTARASDFEELGKPIGLGAQDSRELAEFLKGEGLLEFKDGRRVALTEKGIQEMKATLEDPQQATAHFAGVAVTQSGPGNA